MFATRTFTYGEHRDKIIKEDEYHTINKRYFDEFKNRGDVAIQTIQDKSDGTMSELKVALNQVTSHQNQVKMYRDEVESLRSSQYSTNLMSVLSMMIAGGIATAFYLRKDEK